MVMHAIFCIVGYSFQASKQILLRFEHKPCLALKVVSGMWRFRKTSWNKLNKGTVRVWQSALCFCLLMCSYVCIKCFNFTHLIVLVVHLHKRMQAFSSEWLSTNYGGNLHARRFPLPLGAARRTAPELPLFIPILTSPVHCPCRVTLPMSPFLPSVQATVKERAT